MHKIIELEDRFPTGELTVQLVKTGNGRGGFFFEKKAFDSKTQSPAYEYISQVTPQDGHTFILVNALGAYETYDCNRNGDSFPARPVNVQVNVKCGHKSCQKSAWISSDETLDKHYESFEKHGGIYTHHVNKDKEKSLGEIKKAFWNIRMQRVELLLDIINDKKPDLIKKIGDGEFPAVSMGCHVRYDVCSICGHQAPTRKDYCSHASNELRQVLNSGELVCVHNPSPKFFDISFVFRPADPTGFMLKKVAYDLYTPVVSSAELAEKMALEELKTADVNKLSDLRKYFLGRIMSTRNKMVDKYKSVAFANAKNKKKLTDKDIEKLSNYSLSESLSTLASKDIALDTSEFSRLYLKKAGLNAPDWLLNRINSLQPEIELLIENNPILIQKLGQLVEINDVHVNEKLSSDISSWKEKYARISDFLSPTVYDTIDVGIGPGTTYHYNDPPKTDILTMTDPSTGHSYQTTRGAAQASQKQNIKHHIAGSALLSGLYYHGLNKLFGGRLPWYINLPTSMYGADRTMNFITNTLAPPTRYPSYMTDQGISVPGSTEFKKVSNVMYTTLLDKIASDCLNSTLFNKTANHHQWSILDDNDKVSLLNEKLSVSLENLFDTIGTILLT